MMGKEEHFLSEESQEDNPFQLDSPSDFDLELAAEIGKSLLERNRELEFHLKRSQDYAEEQFSRAEFYLNQIELLREENDLKGRLSEQLDNQLQEVSEKSIHSDNDNKLLRVQNRRLIETVDLLEKRLESAHSELKELQFQPIDASLPCNSSRELAADNGHLLNAEIHACAEAGKDLICTCADTEKKLLVSNEQICLLKKSLNDVSLEQKLYERQTLEMESELKEVLDENERFQQQLKDLQNQLTEWQDIAEKAKQHSHRAQRLSESYDTEKDNVYAAVTTSGLGENLYYRRLQAEHNMMTKSKSCEVLSSAPYKNKENQVPYWSHKLGKLNLNYNGSVLDELDNHYGELVQRYESMLSKFRDDGKLVENPARSHCVQKAIQTMSHDFPPCDASVDQKDLCTTHLTSSSDYRKKFAEIFMKLKEFAQK